MKTQFVVTEANDVLISINPLHPKLDKAMHKPGRAPGVYEADVIKVPAQNFAEGVWVKKPGTDIIQIS